MRGEHLGEVLDRPALPSLRRSPPRTSSSGMPRSSPEALPRFGRHVALVDVVADLVRQRPSQSATAEPDDRAAARG